jgi:hypothetical protein
MSEVAKQGIRLKAIILSLILIALGFLALFLSARTDEHEDPLTKSLLREFATIALIAGTLHVAYEVFQRKDYLAITESAESRLLQRISTLESQVLSRLSIAEQASALGLAEVQKDSNSFPFSNFLQGTKRLVVSLNDGRTWVSRFAPSLRERFEKPGTETIFFLVHPESKYLPVLASRDATNEASLANKITETVSMIRQMCPANANVQVFGHHLHNPHSSYLGDREVLVTPYFHSRVRRTVPLYRFEDTSDGCFFRAARADFESLKLDSVILFQNPESAPADPIARDPR